MPEPGNPQSFNRYSYTRNNPVNFTDPTGHRECGATEDCSDPLISSPPQRLSETAGNNPTCYSLWIDSDSVDGVHYYGNTEFAFNLSAKAAIGKPIPNYSYSQGFHGGIDLEAEEETSVRAGVYGLVEYVDQGAYDPKYIKIKISSGQYLIIGHLATAGPSFRPGDIVTPNTVVGIVSNQDHVHIEFWSTTGPTTIQSPYKYMSPKVFKELQSLVADMNPDDSRINFHFRSDGLWQTYGSQPNLLYGSKNSNLNIGQPGYTNPWN